MQRWNFSSDQRISSFLSEMFRNKMCQTWSKQLENEELYRELTVLIIEHFHICVWYSCQRGDDIDISHSRQIQYYICKFPLFSTKYMIYINKPDIITYYCMVFQTRCDEKRQLCKTFIFPYHHIWLTCVLCCITKATFCI
jgi:hypothetical protein